MNLPDSVKQKRLPVTLGLLLFAFCASCARLATADAYLFAHMTEQDYGGLYYSVSTDGLRWTMLNGGRRVHPDYMGHPDVTLGHDGRYYLLGNPREGAAAILVYASSDLVNWQLEQRLVADLSAYPAVNPPTRWHGAPKMFFDAAEKRYILTWHSASQPKRETGGIDETYWGSMRTWYMTSRDLENWSEPARLFPGEIATIDVIIRREGQRYFAILKDETHPSFDYPHGKSIRIASAPSATGPWSEPSARVSPNFHEAPALIPRPDASGWYLYYEQYPGLQYAASTAPSLEGPWWQLYVKTLDMPPHARHGAMIIISDDQFSFLQEALGED